MAVLFHTVWYGNVAGMCASCWKYRHHCASKARSQRLIVFLRYDSAVVSIRNSIISITEPNQSTIVLCVLSQKERASSHKAQQAARCVLDDAHDYPMPLPALYY